MLDAVLLVAFSIVTVYCWLFSCEVTRLQKRLTLWRDFQHEWNESIEAQLKFTNQFIKSVHDIIEKEPPNDHRI